MTRSQLTTFALAMTAAAALPATLTWKAFTTMPKDPPRVAQSFPVAKTDEEWQASLTPRQYAVLRRHDTDTREPARCSKSTATGRSPVRAAGRRCSPRTTKYESGSGWPSFYAAVEGAIGTNEDRSLGMSRVEIYCSRCGGHLGHVFPDGPRPTGRRYCTNGAALKFEPERE